MTTPTPIPACNACDQPATRHWQRDATDAEAAQYHAAMAAWRRAERLEPFPEDAAILHAPVLVAVYGCDDHGDITAVQADTPNPTGP